MVADKSFKLSDKKRYDLGVPTSYLIGSYEGDAQELTHSRDRTISNDVAQKYLLSPVSHTPLASSISDLISAKTRSKLEQRLLEYSKN